MDAKNTERPLLGTVICPLQSTAALADVFAELATALENGGNLQDGAGFAKAVLLRESAASTALPIGVAMPHARLPELERIILSFGRLPYEMLWGETAVDCVFLMAVPSKQPTAYLALVQKLTRLLRVTEKLEELRSLTEASACRQWLLQQLELDAE